MKSLLIAVAALALGTTLGVVGIRSISAEEATNYPPIIQNLAEKFNANSEDVKGVFEQTREQQQAEMKQQFEENLDQAVADGKITQEQKETFQAKHSAIEKKMEEVRALRQEMRTWAEENDIDFQSLRPAGGKGFLGLGPRGSGM